MYEPTFAVLILFCCDFTVYKAELVENVNTGRDKVRAKKSFAVLA